MGLLKEIALRIYELRIYSFSIKARGNLSNLRNANRIELKSLIEFFNVSNLAFFLMEFLG